MVDYSLVIVLHQSLEVPVMHKNKLHKHTHSEAKSEGGSFTEIRALTDGGFLGKIFPFVLTCTAGSRGTSQEWIYIFPVSTVPVT